WPGKGASDDHPFPVSAVDDPRRRPAPARAREGRFRVSTHRHRDFGGGQCVSVRRARALADQPAGSRPVPHGPGEHAAVHADTVEEEVAAGTRYAVLLGHGRGGKTLGKAYPCEAPPNCTRSPN